MTTLVALLRGLLRFAVVGVLIVVGIVGIFIAWWLVIFAVLALSGYFALRRFFGAKPAAGVPPRPEGAVVIEGEYQVEREDGTRAARLVIEVLPQAVDRDNNRP